MKKSPLLLSLLFITILAFFSSCKKESTAPKASATIIFNGNNTVVADSVYWDYYSTGLPRVRIFKNDIAIVTLWPGTITSGTRDLARQYLYWIIQSPTIYTVNSTGGSLTLANSSDVLSGTFSASGDVYSGTGTSPTTISGTFANIKQYGM